MTKRAKAVDLILRILIVIGVYTIIGSVGSLEIGRISFLECAKIILVGLTLTVLSAKFRNWLFN